MDLRLAFALTGLALMTANAMGQSLYKCQAGGKTTYSDRPCESGTQRTISADGGPTAEERAAAQIRLSRELARQSIQDADNAARIEAQDQVTAAQQAAVPRQPAPDPRANERVMTHSSRGWDYKTRGQIEAEQAARAGRPVNATGAAWETERVTTYGSKGWETGTRLGAAQAEGDRQRRADERAREDARAASQSANGTLIDQFGKTWQRHGGIALDPTTGRTCPTSGNMINC